MADNNFLLGFNNLTATEQGAALIKSTFDNNVHVQHVLTDYAAPLYFVDYLLGDESNAQFDLNSGATLNAAPMRFSKYDPSRAALHLEVSDATGTLSISVDLFPSIDGVTRLPATEANKTSVTVIAAAGTGDVVDGMYSVKLDAANIPSYPYYFPDVVENAGAGGSCDIRLIASGLGA